jgi:hypothetical protein
MKKLVFISHSSNQDPAKLKAGDPRRASLKRARSVRAAIVKELTKFDVWLDSLRIQAGDPWRLEIFQALYRCSAGIILLDDDAFDSPWVRQEAIILNFRRRLNPNFILIPVLLDQGSSDRFDKGDWRPMALRDLMSLKSSPKAVAREIAQRIKNLSEYEEDEDLELWVSTLAGNIRRSAKDQPEHLTAVCEALGIAPEDWAADNASAVGPLARALLTAVPQTVAKVANLNLRPAVPDQEARREMQRLLVPLWVDPTAAAYAAFALRQRDLERRALLNTSDQDIAAEYFDRAVFCAGATIQIRSPDVFGEDADTNQAFVELEHLILQSCPPPVQQNPTSEEFRDWLRRSPYWKPVLFLRARRSSSQLRKLLDQLAGRFPGLTVFILYSGGVPSAKEASALGVTVIDPPLNEAAEKDASYYRWELESFVGR